MAIQGLLSAIVTPFTPNGDLDEPTLRAQVDRQIGEGVHGLIPVGSTGEFSTLSNAERRRVTEIVIDQTAGRVPVVPQIGALTAAEAIGLGLHAQELGATAVLVVAPFYEPLTVDDAVLYHRTVAEALSIPTMIYNIPLATGVNLEPDVVGALAREVPQIQYIKDTSLDMHQAGVLINEYADVLKTFVGLDTFYFVSLTAGGAGAINGAANIIAPELVAVWDAVQAGDLPRAKQLWDVVYPVVAALTSVQYVAGVKAGLDIIGHSAGDPRLPVTALSEEDRAPLAAALTQLLAARQPA